MDSLAANSDGMIDVVNDFQWTSSKLNSRQDIPSVLLKEKRLKTNALAMQLAYYALIVSEKGGEISGRLGNLFSNSKLASGALNGFFNSGIGQSLIGIGDKVIGAASNFGSSLLGSGIGEFFTGKNPSDILSLFSGDSSSNSVLNAYTGLYLTEDTKFVYRLPYFEDNAYSLQNAFADDDHMLTSGLIGGTAKKIADIGEAAALNAAQVTSMTEPGIYIEKPQFYAFGTNGQTESLTIRFPLINTGWSTFEDVQKNWQLLYMLVYQNRPNRKTRDLIDPPCIYEAIIPGVKYMPYCFISSMKVDFFGSRRSYHINIPNKNNGSTKIQTIIPDAYNVTITLKSLVTETQNFLYHMLFEKQHTVNVLETTGRNIIGSILNSVTKNLESESNKNSAFQQLSKRTQN